MADDQSNKTTAIDDLVKELSKNKGSNQSSSLSAAASQEPPPNLPGIKIESKVQTSPISPMHPPAPPPLTGSSIQTGEPKPATTPLPQPLSTVRPVIPQPPPRSTLPTQATQEYRSSIRTMGEDISNVKSGQKPSGIDIPRKISPEMPKAGSFQPVSPTSQSPTSPQVKIGLGGSEKSAPLPSTPAPRAPILPPSKSTTLKPPGIQPPIVVPSVRKGFLNLKLYMLIAGILVVAGFLYWFLVVRITEPKVVLTPTPSPIVTPTPIVRNLSDLFPSTSVNFEVSPSGKISNDFKIFVNNLSVTSGEFSLINLVEDFEGNLISISFLDMLDTALTTYYPTGFRNNVMDSVILVYGQSEAFNQDGSINLSIQNLKRTSFVARIKDKIAIETLMRDWEPTIAKDLAGYLLIADISKEASVNFLDNTYRGVPIKYKNFPFPDVTVDYAVVDSVGQNYLIIAGSREATYATIDILLDQ